MFARQRTALAFLLPRGRPRDEAPHPLADWSSEDTRTHLAWQRTWLAQERTHLAWVRTTLNVVGLGLAIVKFGPLSGIDALAAGLLVVVAGIAVLAYSSRRYHHHTRLRASRRGPVTAGTVLVTTVLTAGLLLVHGHSHHHSPGHGPRTAHYLPQHQHTAQQPRHHPAATTPQPLTSPRSTT